MFRIALSSLCYFGHVQGNGHGILGHDQRVKYMYMDECANLLWLILDFKKVKEKFVTYSDFSNCSGLYI